MVTKYGLFEYKTENIGDEIQSLAAKRFLPQVDYYFDRDNIDNTDTGNDKVKIIMNGWFTHKPENWPPKNPNIIPLFISMYVEEYLYDGAAAKAFVADKSKAYLQKFAPVGARSNSTLQLLQKNNVESYFSGCMTLTLLKSENIEKEEFILLVDVNDKIYEKIKNTTKREIRRIDTIHTSGISREARFTLAEYYLSLYQSAHAVVTTRLHCMLPCLALETTVFGILKKEPYRYSGLIDLVNYMTEEEFLENIGNFSLDKLPKNRKDYLNIRTQLEKEAKKFTGFESSDGFFTFRSRDELLKSMRFSDALAELLADGFRFETDAKNEFVEIDRLHGVEWNLEQTIKFLKKENKRITEEKKIAEKERDEAKIVLENAGVKDNVQRLAKSIKRKIIK